MFSFVQELKTNAVAFFRRFDVLHRHESGAKTSFGRGVDQNVVMDAACATGKLSVYIGTDS